MKKMILTALAAKNMKTILMGAVAVLFLAGTSVAAVAAVPGGAKSRVFKQENKDQKKPDTKPQTKSNKNGKRVTKTNKTMKSGSSSTKKPGMK
ncbi:MAG TPA: hypothetical protein VI112_07690 [Bacteroidia bacterium]|jgi:uncharacterized protein YxeA